MSGKSIPQVLLVLSGFAAANASGQSARGTGFHFGFMPGYSAYDGLQYVVHISADEDATGTIRVPEQGWSLPFSVAAGTTTVLQVPTLVFTTDTDEVVQGKGWCIDTDVPVEVAVINHQNFTSDATILWPTPMLGQRYRILSYQGLQGLAGLTSALLVVSPQDGMTVTITPSAATAGGHVANTPFSFVLDAGQSYLVRGATAADDLTGSLVEAVPAAGSCAGVAVFAGAPCTNVPTGCLACDHLFEQVMPTEAWGTVHHIPDLMGGMSNLVRVVADQPQTTVWHDGVPVVLSAGAFTELTVTGPSVITSDQPVGVALYLIGMTCAGLGDPSLLAVPGEANGVTMARFRTFDQEPMTAHRIALVTDTGGIGGVVLDGDTLPATAFQPFPADPSHAYADLSIATGAHVLSGTTAFRAWSYGLADDMSYGTVVGGTVPGLHLTDTLICHSGGPLLLNAPPGITGPVWTSVTGSDTLGTGPTLPLTPLSNMQVLLIDSTAVACSGGLQYRIEMPPAGTLTASAAEDTVCTHHPVMLTHSMVGAPDPVYWSAPLPGTPYHVDTLRTTLLESTWFTATLRSPLGCWSLRDSVQVVVRPNGISSVVARADPPGMCIGASTQLGASVWTVVAQDAFSQGAAPWWSLLSGATVGSSCGPNAGMGLVLDGAFPRSATTQAFDLAQGGAVAFDLTSGNGQDGCDVAEPGDDVLLETSPDGINWTVLHTLSAQLLAGTTPHHVPLPSSHWGPAVRIRFRQVGTYVPQEDVWRIDNVRVLALRPAMGCVWSPSTGLDDPMSCAPVATLFNNGSYLVTVTDTMAGCATGDGLSVAVSFPPAVELPADTTVCDLSALPFNLAIWNPDWSSMFFTNAGYIAQVHPTGGTLLVDGDATVIAVVTDTVGCSASDTMQVSAVPVAPPFQITGVGDSLCVPDGPFTYIWAVNGTVQPGQDGPCLALQDQGTYSVVVLNALGCGTFAEGFFYGLATAERTEVPMAWYDGASGAIVVPEPGGPFDLRILDLTGRVVLVLEGSMTTRVPVRAHLGGAGAYLAELRNAGGRQVLRFVVD